MHDRGYKNLVALEPSEGMVNEAEKKNVYKDYIIKSMGAEQTSIKEGECNPTSRKELNIVVFLQFKKVTVNICFLI